MYSLFDTLERARARQNAFREQPTQPPSEGSAESAKSPLFPDTQGERSPERRRLLLLLGLLGAISVLFIWFYNRTENSSSPENPRLQSEGRSAKKSVTSNSTHSDPLPIQVDAPRPQKKAERSHPKSNIQPSNTRESDLHSDRNSADRNSPDRQSVHDSDRDASPAQNNPHHAVGSNESSQPERSLAAEVESPQIDYSVEQQPMDLPPPTEAPAEDRNLIDQNGQQSIPDYDPNLGNPNPFGAPLNQE